MAGTGSGCNMPMSILQAMQPPARAPSTSQIWTKNTQYSDDNKKNTEFCHNSPGCFHGVVIDYSLINMF